MPRAADNENWSGMTFANNWEILEKYNCAEYRAIYQEATGDTTKKIKNAHYLVKNNNCGIETYMERTTIGRAINGQTPIMKLCKGCINGSKYLNNDCHYAEMCRIKPLTKIPERTSKVKINEIYGNFKVLAIEPSANYSDHQCRAKIKCIYCGKEQESRFDTLLNNQIACDCFRSHSSGEQLIQTYLEQNNILYEPEYTFEDLYGPKGKPLRYDFAVLNKNNNPIWLIEFDGKQHYEEAGTYFNKDGSLQVRDEIKNKYAKENNIPLTRIPYTEILNISKILDTEKIKYI